MTKVHDSDEKMITQREFEIRFEAHQREHDLHQTFHETEHHTTETALVNADRSLERRLEGMNEFRAQLERQAGAFLTREIFEQYSKEQGNKVELALANNVDKYDTIIKAIVNRHDSDMESARVEIQTLKENLRSEIQSEREHRKTFEGSINTWKWLLGFIGASGLGGVILLLIERAQ